MSLSESLYQSWQRFCAVEVGHQVDINDIEPCLISHIVPPGKPALQCADGAVRKLSMAYDQEDVDNELPN